LFFDALGKTTRHDCESDHQHVFYGMSPLSPCCSFYCLWGPGCGIAIIYMLFVGISVAKQTEATYGTECNNHSPPDKHLV